MPAAQLLGPSSCRALFGSAVFVLSLFAARTARADETHGEDDRYRWTHSEETSTDDVLEDGTEVRIHSVTIIKDRRWVKKEAEVGPPGEVLIFDQFQKRTHTERWDGTSEDENYASLTRKDEYALQLPEDSYQTVKKVKTVPTGPDTGTSEQSTFSSAIMYSVNPNDPESPFSWSSRAEQKVTLKYIGDFVRPIGDEFVDCSRSFGNLAIGFDRSTYRRRATWGDDGNVAVMTAAMGGPNVPVPGAIYEYIPAEGWRANGVLIPANRLDETIQLIRATESSSLSIFPDFAPQQEYVPNFLDQAMGVGPMA